MLTPRFVLGFWIAVSTSACASVAPWDRAKLAEPTMDPGDDQSVGREHMQSVHEGAVGGTRIGSSGCGCN